MTITVIFEGDRAKRLTPRMRNFKDIGKDLRELLGQRVLMLDGAMGTMLQQRDLTAADFGGATLEGCNEVLVRTRPDVVLDIHRAYFAAGADIVETNSFGGTPLVLAEYGLDAEAQELNKKAAELARAAADEFHTTAKPRFVAGSMGPTTKAITVTGGVTFEGLRENYYLQAKGLLEGGADLLLVETCQDTRNIKAALLAIERLSTGDWQPSTGDCVGDDRADGNDVGRADGGSDVGVAATCEAAGVWDELRHRAGIHDRPHSNAECFDGRVCIVLSERGIAG